MSNITLKILNPLSVILGLDYKHAAVTERAALRNAYIKEQRSKGYKGVFWDYLEYIPGAGSDDPNPWFTKEFLISDHGAVVGIRRNKLIFFKPFINQSGYPKLSLRLKRSDKRVVKPTVHRALASTFIPRDNPNQDQVNHKDMNRRNPILSNLEWLTGQENKEHAIINGRGNPTTPLRAKWMCNDEHHGLEFVMISEKALMEAGFRSKAIYSFAKERLIRYGCLWSLVTEHTADEVGVPSVLGNKPFDRKYIREHLSKKRRKRMK